MPQCGTVGSFCCGVEVSADLCDCPCHSQTLLP